MSNKRLGSSCWILLVITNSLLACIACFLTRIRPCVSLSLLAGQRIASRPGVLKEQREALKSTTSRLHFQRMSIFDLPNLEQWASERGLQEHHLKSVYRIVMQDSSSSPVECDDDFEKRLIQADFPRSHAGALVADFCLCNLSLVETRPSSSGGYKLVMKLPSGQMVETVLIQHNHRSSDKTRYTVCVSSQVGCAKACTFCATGTMGLQANLSSAHILEQVWLAQRVLSQQDPLAQVRNVVFMGMGEPLDNYSAVHEACRGLTHQCLFGLRSKHVTISTVGDTPERIRDLATEAPQISLALSLHGATQARRTQLIPSAARAPLVELEQALDYHSSVTGRGVMLEYLLIENLNDGLFDAQALARFCKARTVAPLVNLIPYNPTLAGTSLGYTTPSEARIDVFHQTLRGQGVNSLVRWSSASGRDAEGACGQLALNLGSKQEQVAN